ncbi:MAG: dihydroneopterin aldolase [Candidatus Tumulicola sp.]
MGRITLSGIRAYGRHGVFPHERESAAPFDLRVSIDADLTAAAASDDLADTIDYDALHRRLVSIVAETSFALLERLAAALIDAVLEDPRVLSAEVTVAKPDILDGATPAVTLSRRRDP